jgi:hypothetical protein
MQNELTNLPVLVDDIRLPGPYEKSGCDAYRKDNEPDARPVHARPRKLWRRHGFFEKGHMPLYIAQGAWHARNSGHHKMLSNSFAGSGTKSCRAGMID